MLQVCVLENSLDRVHVVLHVGDKLDNPGEVDGHQQAVADEEAKGGGGKGVVDDMLGHEQSDGDGDEDDQGSDDVEGQSKPSTSRLIERGLLLESKDFESKIKGNLENEERRCVCVDLLTEGVDELWLHSEN